MSHTDSRSADALLKLLISAFEAGHFAWPSPDTPTREAQCERWFKDNAEAVQALVDRLAVPEGADSAIGALQAMGVAK